MDAVIRVFLGIVVLMLLGVFWLLWEMNIIQTLWNCDSTDYSPIIKKVAIPMQEELEKFYTKNKRFPNTQERDEMLVKVGCKMEGNVCLYEGERIVIERGYKDSYNGDYDFWTTLENTTCFAGASSSGKYYKVNCRNKPCIKLGQ